MAKKDIAKMKDLELLDLLRDSQEELRKEKFNVAGAGSKDAKKISNLRKTIARVLTERKVRDIK